MTAASEHRKPVVPDATNDSYMRDLRNAIEVARAKYDKITIFPGQTLVAPGLLDDLAHELKTLPCSVHVTARELEDAARLLLKIWKAIPTVKSNTSMRACIYLARRGTSLVQFLCTAIDGVGDAVADEFELAIAHFVKSLRRMLDVINRQADMSFIKRYLRRKETEDDLEECDQDLTDVWMMFGGSVAALTLKAQLARDCKLDSLEKRAANADRWCAENTAALLAAIPQVRTGSVPADSVVDTK